MAKDELNKDFIKFHLGEAAEAAEQAIKEMTEDPEYDIGNLIVDMRHLYHHVNSAWNARHASEERARACSEADGRLWEQYPSDLELV